MQLQTARSQMHQVAVVALCFAKELSDAGILRAGQETVRLPVALLRQMDGCQLSVTPPVPGEDMIVRIRQRLPEPFGREP